MSHLNDSEFCFPDDNTTCFKATQSRAVYIFLYMFLFFLSSVAIFLNLLVIISIFLVKKLHTPTNVLVASLALTDFLVGIVVIPIETIAELESCWYFGKNFCPVFLYFTYLITSVSLGHLVLISIDRYVAICDPLLYHSRITMRRTASLVFLVWSCCILYNALILNEALTIRKQHSRCFDDCVMALGSVWSMIDIFVTLVIPCSMIITLYLKIFVVAKSHSKVKPSRQPCATSPVVSTRPETKAAKTLGIVIFSYILCWIPFFICSYTGYSITSFQVGSWIIYLNSCLNPVIYAFFYPWFKKTILHLFQCQR